MKHYLNLLKRSYPNANRLKPKRLKSMPLKPTIYKTNMLNVSAFRNNQLMLVAHAPLIILASLVFVISACSKPMNAEQDILNNIELIKHSAQALRTKKIEEFLAEDYFLNAPTKNNTGFSALSSEQDLHHIKRMLLGVRLKKQSLEILIRSNKVTLDKHSTHLAEVESDVLFLGMRGLLPQQGKAYTIKSHWRLFNDDWKITSVTWQE